MTTTTVVMLLLMGCGGGFLAGLLGVGGGMVLVPFLVMIFDHVGHDPTMVVQTALATALATIMFTSLSSMRAHHRKGAVQWNLVWLLAPGILVGGQLGSRIVAWLPGQVLAVAFALFVGWMGSRMLRGARRVEPDVPARLPGRLGLAAVGTGIGGLSAIFGAGGGFVTVPFLNSRGVPLPKAIATSAACGFPIAFSGTLGYMVMGWWQGLPGGALAYLDVRALFTIVPMSMLFAPVGAYMALNIGANDVANNMGPAVGSNALTLGSALLIAAIFETAGAMLAGGEVVNTIASGIVSPEVVQNADTFILLMMAALLAAALWLNLATYIGAPVSTTHAVVGGVVGAGVGRIAVISPSPRRTEALLRQDPALTAAMEAPGGDVLRSRLLVVSPVLSKGLEFDVVVLVDPARIGDHSPGDLYVAMTRPTRRLRVLSRLPLPHGLEARTEIR